MGAQKSDNFFMQQALKEAEKAALKNEVPVGAVVVNESGDILGRSYNQTIKKNSPLGHAEIVAISKAAHALNDWRLDGCTLYVTLEPCALCMQLIIMSRITRVVYGAVSPLFGYSRDKHCIFDLSRMPLVVEKGIEAEAAQTLLKQFFTKKRSQVHGTKKITKSRARKDQKKIVGA
ncbi:TPA: tRNA-specific adenosine deaminase [Candidatus Dependentiae bacterium]|nr:tRNA-specific adenosine deaminase [Candidatus Dependentiae bacterium]HCU00987.1 tRNA-specific adenosine deaminase [Candidatus Dependentiae bacterium]